MESNQPPQLNVLGAETPATTWIQPFPGGLLPQYSEVPTALLQEYQTRFPLSDLRLQCRRPWRLHSFLALDNEPEYEDTDDSPVFTNIEWPPDVITCVLPAQTPTRPSKNAIYCPDAVEGVPPFPNLMLSTLTADRTNCDLCAFPLDLLLAVCNVCGLPAYPTGRALTPVTARAAVLDLLHHMVNLTIEDFDFASAHLHRYTLWGPVAIGLLYGWMGIPRDDTPDIMSYLESYPGVTMARRLVAQLNSALAAGQLDSYTMQVMSVLQDIVLNLGVKTKVADHLRSAPTVPPILPFDTGVVMHILYQALYNPEGPWLGGIRGIQTLIHVMTGAQTPLGPPVLRSSAHALVLKTLKELSPLFWINPLDHPKFTSLPFPQQVAVVIQGPVWLLDYDPEESATRFRHSHMNLGLRNIAHCPNVLEGRFLLSIHGGDPSIQNTATLRSLLWALYKGYAALGLAGANPLALMTSFTNPCKDAAQLTLRMLPGHEVPVDDLTLTDFGGLRGAQVIQAAYHAIGGDEFYTMCGRNMPTILQTTKFHRDYLVYSVARLPAGPRRQSFIDTLWQKQFSLFHCYSGIHPKCPSNNIKIPVTSYNPDSKQGTENPDRMHGAPNLLTAEQYVTASCYYVTQEFTDVLNEGTGLEHDHQAELEARPSPAVLDESDAPILPPCPTDFGDAGPALPFQPPSDTEAAAISLERQKNAKQDAAAHAIVWYPPAALIPRTYAASNVSPENQARRDRANVVKQQRIRDRVVAPPVTTGKRNDRDEDSQEGDETNSDSGSESAGASEPDDPGDPQPGNRQPPLAANQRLPASNLQSFVSQLAPPPPRANSTSAGIAATALAALAGLANPPNVLENFHDAAVPAWDVRANTQYGHALNNLVTNVPYAAFRPGDVLVTWAPTIPGTSHVDPAYRGTPPHTHNSDWVLPNCTLSGWRRGRTEQGSTVWYLAFSSVAIPQGFATRLLITPARMTRLLPRLKVQGAQVIKGQLEAHTFFAPPPRSTTQPDPDWQGNDQPPGHNPPDKHKSSSGTTYPQNKKKRPESKFAAPMEQRSHFAAPVEQIDDADDDAGADPTNVPKPNRPTTSPNRNSMPAWYQDQVDSDEDIDMRRRRPSPFTSERSFIDPKTGAAVIYNMDNERQIFYEANQIANKVCNVADLPASSGMSVVAFSNPTHFTFLRRRASEPGGITSPVLRQLEATVLYAALFKDKNLMLQFLNLDFRDVQHFDQSPQLSWGLFLTPEYLTASLKSSNPRSDLTSPQLQAIYFLQQEQLWLRFALHVPQSMLECTAITQQLMFPRDNMQFYPPGFILDTFWTRRVQWSSRLLLDLADASAHSIMTSFVTMAYGPAALNLQFDQFLLWQLRPTTDLKKGAERIGDSKTKRDATSSSAKAKKTALKAATTTNVTTTGKVTVQLPSALSTPAKSVCLNDLRNVLSSTDHPACVRPQCPHQHLSSSPKTMKFSRSTLIIPTANKTSWAQSPANLKLFTDLLDAHKDKRLTK